MRGTRLRFFSFIGSQDGNNHFMAWRAHRDSVIGRAENHQVGGVEPPAESAVVWRLLSSNNRELARSASAHPTLQAARRAVMVLQPDARELILDDVTDELTGRLAWFATQDGRQVMTSCRWFDDRRSRARNIAMAVVGLSEAEVATTSVIVRPTGANIQINPRHRDTTSQRANDIR